MNEQNPKSDEQIPQKLSSLCVYNAGWQHCTPGFKWGPGIRDHYQIHYVIAGKGSYRVNGITHHFQTGDTFLIYPNTEFVHQADESVPWECVWVSFTGSDVTALLNSTDFSERTPYIRQIPHRKQIQHYLIRIYEMRGSEFGNAVEMAGLLYTMFAQLIHDARKDSRQTATVYVQKSIDYISANYSYPITIEEIAANVGLSRSHLFRSFELVLHQSPKEYLTNFRMKQACNLLQSSSLSIAAIANSVGFDNGFYFSRSFHKMKNMSPKEYRKRTKKTSE